MFDSLAAVGLSNPAAPVGAPVASPTSGLVSGPILGPVGAPSAPGARRWTPRYRRGAASLLCKRALDLAVAGLVLLALWPALILIALAILLETPGPILFRQRRTGKDGRVFLILKFRTMTVTEDGDAIRHCFRRDPRVTRVGAFLRASSLDELPQLINVLKGEMSLVGPRPHAVAHDRHYGALLPDYGARFAVLPGLTGLAQASGLHGEIQQLGCMARRVQADAAYAAGWSFRDDLILLWRTVPVLLDRLAAA
ncbi:sugar transferase [Brevundimonas sp. SORGH_AS_0993]|uniref:sugar transferase n=1 Tax=Brevundimonas sp. SORGH_AS_0993 TaxID=3041794 RepID=UPI00278B8409|nr:sugar transferase [Brevundimonas sp. SORGH_AS_0993]MDQ1155130.1 putative colanic acid biosynthesis UDP-glucose lipid carrier transferase [Brevundimonas sp. SORGH_AS_0993]